MLRKESWIGFIVATTLSGFLMLGLAACGSSPSEPDTSDSQNQAQESQTDSTVGGEPQKSTKSATVIGDRSENAKTAVMRNALGEDIASFMMRKMGESSWGPNLLKANEAIRRDESVDLRYASDNDGIAYEFSIALQDGRKVQMGRINLDMMRELTLYIEDGVGYVTYKTESGVEGSTKQGVSTTQRNNANENSTPSQEEYVWYEDYIVNESYNTEHGATAADEQKTVFEEQGGSSNAEQSSDSGVQEGDGSSTAESTTKDAANNA